MQEIVNAKIFIYWIGWALNLAETLEQTENRRLEKWREQQKNFIWWYWRLFIISMMIYAYFKLYLKSFINKMEIKKDVDNHPTIKDFVLQ